MATEKMIARSAGLPPAPLPIRGNANQRMGDETPVDGASPTNSGRKFFGILKSILRESRLALITTPLFVLAMVGYQHLAMTIYYPIRGSIDFDGDAIRSVVSPKTPLAIANFGAMLVEKTYAPSLLSTALQKADASQTGIMGLTGNSVDILHKHMYVHFNILANRLEFELDSSSPHQAALLVNCVIATLMADRTPVGGAGDAPLTITPEMVVRVNAATAAVEPFGPSPVMLLLMSAAAGLTLGLLIAAYRGIFRPRLGSPDEIRDAVGILPVGYLPQFSSKLSPAGRGLAAYIDPMSEVAVSCRSLLLGLFGTSVSKQSGFLLITSPGRGEGRSTVALNLAVTLALTGERVLLVDADTQSPMLHKLLTEPDSTLGFCEALDNPAIVNELVRPTHINGLHFLSCGKPSSTAAAKLQSSSLKQVMSVLREKYRYVVFDAGPVLGNPDTLALAYRCHAISLVLHARRTRPASAAEAVRLLRRVKARQVAAILNALPDKLSRKYFNHQASGPTSNKKRSESYSNIRDYGLVSSP